MKQKHDIKVPHLVSLGCRVDIKPAGPSETRPQTGWITVISWILMQKHEGRKKIAMQTFRSRFAVLQYKTFMSSDKDMEYSRSLLIAHSLFECLNMNKLKICVLINRVNEKHFTFSLRLIESHKCIDKKKVKFGSINFCISKRECGFNARGKEDSAERTSRMI